MQDKSQTVDWGRLYYTGSLQSAVVECFLCRPSWPWTLVFSVEMGCNFSQRQSCRLGNSNLKQFASRLCD